MSQVGIDPKAAQDIEEVDGEVVAPAPNEDAEGTEQPAEETPSAPASDAEGVQAINDALKNLEAARDGSFEEYGRALDALDRAVQGYQAGQ